MSKFVKLLAAAYVNGVLRNPHEGVLHLEDAEADRLIEVEAAVDVTKDFSADDRNDVPVENIGATPPATSDLAPVEHQANAPLPKPDDAKNLEKSSVRAKPST